MILLDSSFLLTMLKEHRNPLDEISDTFNRPSNIAVLDLVILELQRLSRTKKGKKSKLARLVLDELDQWKTRIVQAPFGPRAVDLLIAIYALAYRGKISVATVDRKLQRTLRKNGVNTIIPRSRSGLIAS